MPEYFGLDIGSHSLKAVELEKEAGGHFRLVAFGSALTPAGATFSESDLDQKELANTVKVLLKESRIKSRQAVSAFPESLIFTRVVEMPNLSDQQLKNAITYEAEQYIPMPLSEVKTSFMVLQREEKVKDDKGRMKVLLVAAPLSLIERYLKTLRMAGIEPVAFETETVAIVRALTDTAISAPTTLYISIGASTTDLCITENNIIQFTRSIGTGGTALARAIAQELGFEMVQAEEYKKSYGLLPDQLEGKILQTIKPVFDVIVNETERAILYFQTHNPLSPIRRVVLTGGSAMLPGIIAYLAENLGVEVQIGNPWANIKIPPELKEKIDTPESQANFSVAVGLAMKNVSL